MKVVTLLFLRKPDERQLLLAQKKRGFGMGKINGVGGKVQQGESVETAAVREAEEEIGVAVSETSLKRAGVIMFHFLEHADWDLECHVFFAHEWKGEPAESDEMAPKWYTEDAIPFEQMWVDDRYWLRRALAGEYIDATFYFSGDGSAVEKAVINGVEETHVGL